MFRHVLTALLAAALATTTLPALSGCATLEQSPQAAELTVQYATFKIIDSDLDRADRVVELVQDARRYVTDDASVSVSLLDHEIRNRINWGALDPADRLLINAILDEARRRLEQEIGAGLLDADQKVAVLTVLDWIERAAHHATQ